jgi:hypothetical protein
MGSRGMALGQSLRDRTADFNAITARLQKQAGVVVQDNSPVSAAHAAAKQAVQQQSEFARKASQIGLSIHKTSVKLQKLAQLAKRTSMFDDPTREIDEMTGIIKHDIQVSLARLGAAGVARGPCRAGLLLPVLCVLRALAALMCREQTVKLHLT